MDLVRLKSEERLYDRDVVLGRDSASVFPTETAANAAAERSAAAEAIGGRTFITEAELETLKAGEGDVNKSSEDAPKNDGRPLAVVLADNKQAKEDAFQAQWTQMKTDGIKQNSSISTSMTNNDERQICSESEFAAKRLEQFAGKNRPLDEDELEFLNGLQQQEATAEEAWRSEQASQLDAFQQAVKQRAKQSKVGTDADDHGKKQPYEESQEIHRKNPKKNQAARSAPVIKVIRKATAADNQDGLVKRSKLTQAAEIKGHPDNVTDDSRSDSLAALIGNYSDGSD